MNDNPHILVYTLGRFSVERRLDDGTDVPISFATPGPVTYENHIESLLGYLLCCPGRQAFRTSIMDELWENKSNLVSLDTYMYRAVSGLSKALGGEPYFKRTHKKQKYELAEQSLIWNDAEHCEGLIEAAKRVGPTTDQGVVFLQEAQYYLSRGTFLPREAGSWAYSRRSKMETLSSDCMNWLLDAYQARGEDKLLEETAEQMLRADPLNSTALYYLMIALEKRWMGQEALRRYRETTALARKGGQVLSSDVQHLAQQLEQKRQNRPILSFAPPTSGHLASSPSQSVNPQGILVRSAGANASSLDDRNLRNCYLVSSTDIVPSLKVYSTYCQRELTACQQQIDIYETIEQRRTMNDKDIRDPSQITRRDLFTLAVVSPSLLTNIRREWPSAGTLEEFLSEVTASVTTCWYLLQRSDSLPVVEWAVPQYLPELVEVVKHFSLQRKRAACLTAQGFLLLSLMDLHRVRHAERVAHCQKAVTYAQESGDLTLLVTSLGHLSDAFLINGLPDESLRTYLQAKGYSESAKLSGLSRSMILAGLSHPYARQGKSQEVFRCLGEARNSFTKPDNETPVFLLANDLYQIIQDEGFSILELGNHAKERGDTDLAQKYYEGAAEKFGEMEQLPSSVLVPARIAAEVAIAQALAYTKARNMEGFLTTFEKGAKLAIELGSEKRKQEAREALNAALEQWSNDQQIAGLWELLV